MLHGASTCRSCAKLSHERERWKTGCVKAELFVGHYRGAMLEAMELDRIDDVRKLLRCALDVTFNV